MKRGMLAISIVLFCLSVCGCSVPRAVNCSQFYGFFREEKRVKGVFGGKNKVVLITDFRGNEIFEENMAAVKEEVEKYISAHPDLSEAAKFNLRELKVTEGLNPEQVELLLGKPDRVIKSGDKNRGGSEIWIYRINKMNAFTIFIFPVFLAHEGYYLSFKDNCLASIQKHYLTQIIQQGSAPGLPTSKK